MSCEMKECNFFLDDLESTLVILFDLARDHDMRSYIYTFWMVDYARVNDTEKLLQLLDFASLITFIFLNLLDNDNKERKKHFCNSFRIIRM